MIRLYILALLLAALSCKEKSGRFDASTYRHLDTNKVNILYKYEKFVLYNARTDGLEYDNSLYFDIDTNFVRLLDTHTEESPSDCAGCTTSFINIYQTLKEGQTSIRVFKSQFSRDYLVEQAREISDSLLLSLPQEILDDSLLTLQKHTSLFENVKDSLFRLHLNTPILTLKLVIRSNVK